MVDRNGCCLVFVETTFQFHDVSPDQSDESLSFAVHLNLKVAAVEEYQSIEMVLEYRFQRMAVVDGNFFHCFPPLNSFHESWTHFPSVEKIRVHDHGNVADTQYEAAHEHGVSADTEVQEADEFKNVMKHRDLEPDRGDDAEQKHNDGCEHDVDTCFAVKVEAHRNEHEDQGREPENGRDLFAENTEAEHHREDEPSGDERPADDERRECHDVHGRQLGVNVRTGCSG